MVIRRIDPSENLSLDQPIQADQPEMKVETQPAQSKIRKLGPNEKIMLDQERAQIPSRYADPVYFPQEEKNSSSSGLLEFGATDAARRAYEFSGNITSKLSDAADSAAYGAEKAYYEIFGYPEKKPQIDVLKAPETNRISAGLTASANEDFANANILAGRVNEMNVQPTVDWEQVKKDPLTMKTLRFMAEQGLISTPEMLTALIPYLGLPTVMGTTAQSIIEDRQRNLGKEHRDISGDDLLFATTMGGVSGGLERVGALASTGLLDGVTRTTLRQIPKNALESGVEEAVTESIQNPIEMYGSTAGTDNEMTAQDLIDSSASGALVGFGMGSTMRAGTDSVRALKDGVTTQPMDNGGATPDENALNKDVPLLPPPAPAAPPVPNRDDLARMINTEPTIAKNATVQPETVKPPIAGTPEVGDTIEHVDQYGQVIEGKVDSIQEGENGQKTLIVTDSQGEQNIVFEGSGETLITDRRPLNRDDLLSAIQSQPTETIKVESKPKEVTEESLQSHIDSIRAQAKMSGWNGMLKRREQEALNELSAYQQRQINEAAAQADPEPTEAMKEAGNYKKGHVKVSGFDITIENAKGSVRKGIDSDGEAWETTMPANYGYIKRTEGADGDNVDVYIGDNPDAQEVFIVDQIDPVTGKFDEHKVMLGFNTSKEAGDAYKAAFSDGKGVNRVGAVEGMTIPQFKEWLKTSDTKKPIVYQEPTAITPEPIVAPVAESPPVIEKTNDVKQGEVGMMLTSGQVVTTITGRQTTPFPKFSTDTPRKTSHAVKNVENWLMQNALAEAQSRGDEFNALQFKANMKKPSQADKDSAEYYLFDATQPQVQKSIFRDPKPVAISELETTTNDPVVAKNEQTPSETSGDYLYDKYGYKMEYTSFSNQDGLYRLRRKETSPDGVIKEYELHDDGLWYDLTKPIPNNIGPLLMDEQNSKKEISELTKNLSNKKTDQEPAPTPEPAENQPSPPQQPEKPQKNGVQKKGVKISDVSVNDSRGGEMFGYKELTVDGTAMSAADINLYDGGVYIQNIMTKTGETRKGYAKKLVDDLFREFPNKTIYVSNMTDDGSQFFNKNYNVGENGVLTKKEAAAEKKLSEPENVPETPVSSPQQTPDNKVNKVQIVAVKSALYEAIKKAGKDKTMYVFPPEEALDIIKELNNKSNEQWGYGVGATVNVSKYYKYAKDGIAFSVVDGIGRKINISDDIKTFLYPETDTKKQEQDLKEPTQDRGRKMQDVGEKLEGKRALQDKLSKASYPEKAKTIIEATRPKNAFKFEKQSHQTDGIVRFAQAIQDGMFDFSGYLKSKGWIFNYRSKYSKSYGWEQQIANIFAEGADLDGAKTGDRHSISEGIVVDYRKKIEEAASDYIDLSSQLNEMFANSSNIEQFKAELFAELDKSDSEFSANFGKFAKTYRLSRDIFSDSIYSPFAKITDDTEAKKTNRVEKTLSRPKLEKIERIDLKDYRSGKDVSEKEFMDTFGFRGVEFGEWVSSKEGQGHVNLAFDALMDLANRLNISPKHISIGGKLGFAFGSRGKGEHSAHFEPSNNVINLTKTRGDGAVSHEWFHALDYNIRKSGPDGVKFMDMAYKSMTHSPIDDAEAKIQNRLKDFLTGQAFWQRSSRRLKMGAVGEAKYTIEQYISRPYEFLFKRTQYSRNGDALGKDYWGTPIELIARAWEGYIYDTLGGSSPYLVSDWVAEGVVTKENGYRGTVFPDGEERKNIKEFFDSFLKSVEFTADGVKVKEGWNLPIQSDLDKMVNMVKSFEPKLNEMMKEIEDASVQQTDVRAVVPDSNVPTGTDDVSGVEPQGDFEEGDNGQGDGGTSAVSKNDGQSQTKSGDGERGRADSNGDSVQRDDTVPEPINDAAPIYSASGTNHKIAVGALDEKRKSKQKATDNVKIIKTVKQIESENRAATPEEQILLAKYTGWGSIKNAFPKSDGVTIEDGWSDINSQLKSLLTEKEYKEARSSIQYAHYTSEIVVRSMWDAMKRFGLNKGNVFEPGMGIGNFAGMIPDGMDIQYSGLEIDPMTYRISRILYPEASVRNADFTAARYGDDTFDAAIGNPPFSDRIISADPKYKSKKLNVHNYFFAKTLDMIAPGGVMGFVTSRYSMDSMDSSARELLASKADLIGAIRLPNTAFKTNANTEVVTDIIFLRKRLPNEKSNGVNWLKTREMTIKDSYGAPVQVPINEFFHDNPEMILGNVSLTGSMYSKNEFTVEPSESSDLQQQLSEAIASLPENVITDIQKSKTQGIDYTPQEAKEGSFYMKDGVLMQIDSGVGSPVSMRGKGTGGISKVDAEKIQMLIPVRDALRKAMLSMVNRNDKEVKKHQKELDKAYDAFVKKYGPITKSETESRPPSVGTIEEYRNAMREDFKESGEEFNEGTIDLSNLVGKTNPETGKKYTEAQIGKIRKEKRDALEAQGIEIDNGDFNPSDVPDSVSIKYPNLDAFMDDPEAYDLMMLEDYDENTGTAKKTDVFTKNIVAEIKKPELKTSVDALNYSLSRMNAVNIDFMAQELGKNADSIVNELEELDLIYRIPNSDGSNKHIFVYAEEYLSGLVKDKLEYAKKLAKFDPIYNRNVLALEAVQPKDIPASDINTQLGSPYFDEGLIKDFMSEVLSISVSVNRIKSINNWTIESRDNYSPENTTIWGTPKRSATELVESLLMRKNIQVTTKDPEGKQVVDVAETQAAQDKAKIIQEKFSEWIWKSSHADRIFRSYNDEYNNIVPRKYDGSHITTAISPQIKLRSHQNNVIWRIIQSGNTYMAHAVGAGKTLSMASAAMEMRRLGMWRKPMLVVPNHMIAQFAGEFKLAYPQANILIADEKKFHKDKRNRFVANVAKGDWDAVIMTFSSFSKIPVSAGFEAKMLDEQLDKYRFALQDAQKASGKRSSTASKIESQIKKMEERLNKLKREDIDQSFYFEQLGVDALMLDEAHNYRKLSFQTNQGTMKGVTPVGAKSSWDLYSKSKFLDTVHPGKNLVLASGTPLTNTLAEVFTIQRFMDERALKDRGLDTFDSWSSAFAASVTNPERQPSGSYKTVTRLSEFRNLGALSPMVRDFMDVVTSDELASLVNRPTMKSGSMIIRTVKPTTAYLAFQKYLESRTNAISGKRSNEKGADNILNIIGEGRLAAIDMRLIDPTLPEEKSKLTDMVDNIHRIWEETSKDSFKNAYAGDDRTSNIKGGTQLVFSDLGVNAKSKDGVSFSAYDYIRRTLVRKGVPAKEIAFMSDYETFEDKRRLQNMVKSGEIRILIGSTRKMGTGLNVQNRLKAVHNLDAPWLPADLEQRTGRALRQGNQYKEIEIYGYGTEGSYDSTMWGMLETKAKAIIQFLKGDGDISSMRDIEETDQFRLAKAMTSGDPRVLKQAELQSDVERLARQSRNFTNEQVQIKSNIANKKAGIEKAKKYISDIEEAKSKIVRPPDGEFLMTVSGRPYTERAEAAGALDAAIAGVKSQNMSTPSGGVKIAYLYGFDVKFFMGIGNFGTNYEIFLDHQALVGSGKQWSTEDGLFSPTGSITTMLNSLNKLDKIQESEIQRIEANKREIGVLESKISGDFPKQEELVNKTNQLKEIENDLKLNAPVEVTYDEYPIGYWERNKAAMNNSAMFSIVGADEYKISNKGGEKSSSDKIIAELNKQAKKLGLPENSAVLFENLGDIKNVPNLAKASQDGAVVEGFYYKNLIYIAMTSKDYISTLNHEAVHYLKAAGAFTPAEWSALLEKAPKWRKKYKIQKNYGDLNLTESKLDEEAIAHALQDYSNQGILTRIRNKIIKYFNMIKSVVTGKGFDYKTPEALFDDILSGEIGRRRFDPEYDVEPMFSRTKKAEDLPLFSRIGGMGHNGGPKMTKEGQLEQAIASLDARGLADKLRPAIGKIASYVLHPHQIASLYKSFTPVYLGAIEMMKTRDVLVHKLSKNIHAYNKMNKKSKAKLDAVLEIGRLSKQNYKPNADGQIVVKNDGYKDTLHSKDGDTITLTDVEARAYQGVRDAMDLALDTYSRTILEEYGFIEMGINNKSELIKALAKEKNKSTIKQMQDVLKIIQDIEDAKRKGYIPLKRWGEIGITVRANDNEKTLVHFERIELPSNKIPFIGRKNVIGENKAVIEAVKRLREKYPASNFEIDNFEVKDFTSLQAKINLNELDVLAASSDMSEADYDTLREMIADAMKRRGFRQHFFQSNDVSGYSGDFERAINDYVVSISGHLSRRMHIPKLDAAVRDIERAGEASLFDYARKYVSYITDPVEEFGAVRQMAYMWYLAGNVASGVTNATQPFMVTAPWFKAMFSHGQIAKQMAKAYKDTTAMASFKNGTDVFDFSKAPADVREALERANAEGYFIPLQTYDAMAIANSNSSYMRGASRRVRDMMDVLSLTFSVPERTNRVVTYISAYRFAIQPENKQKIMAFISRDQLGRASLVGKNGGEFAEAFADYAVMSTQLRMGKLNRPTLSRGAGTLPFQFMSFSLQMLELMYRLKKVHGGKGAMSVAMMLFAVVAMAGIKGIPFEDDLQKLFEAAYKKLTRTDIDIDSEMLKLLTRFLGKTAAQAIVKGIPYAIANVDMSGRLGYGNIVPDGQSDLLGVWFDMFVTKPTQAATDIARGDELQAFANIAPAFLRNPIQAYLWATEGVKSGGTGDTIIPPEDLTKTDIGMKMFGFTSSNVAGERSRIYAEKRASTAVNELRSDYYDRLARAYAGMIRASRNDDKETMNRYVDEIEAITIEKNTYNEDAPPHKQIIIRQHTLKQRVAEEINGAKANKPRKQARQEAEELKKVWGN